MTTATATTTTRPTASAAAGSLPPLALGRTVASVARASSRASRRAASVASTASSADSKRRPTTAPAATAGADVAATSDKENCAQQQRAAAAAAAVTPVEKRSTRPVERIYETVVDSRGVKTQRSYIKGRFLGKGGFASCYEVLCEQTQRRLACKLVSKESLAKPKAINKIKIHKSLQHPNVVAFDRYFEDDNNAYILLELCRNQSLSDLLRRRKRLSEAEVRFYVRQLVEGLIYLHKNLVIHRDLKLGNLFLTADMRLKIGDFGLAALLDNAFDRKRTLCGTPNYIAPEILTGRTTTGHSFEVDIWSTGVVMYTLLVGRPPFETDDVKHTYRRIRASDFAFPDDIDISANAKAIVHSILRVEPHLRPSLNAILAHPFFQERPTPVSLPKTALLITPPECKRVIASNKRSKEASPSDHKARSNPPPPPQKTTLATRQSMRKREVSSNTAAEKSATTPAQRVSQRQPLAAKPTTSSSSRPPPVPHSVVTDKAKSIGPLDGTSSRASTATSETPSPPTTTVGGTVDSEAMNAEAPPSDPFAIVQETLARFFYLEEHGSQDDKLSEFSSASVLVAAAKRVKEIRLEHEAASAQPLMPATLWVSQWVDYTSKYGMGYVLSDGSAGVYFNDSTKIVSSSDAMTLEYVARSLEGNASSEPFVRFPSDMYDGSLKKKVTLLNHFKSYLIDEREKRPDIAAFEAQVSSQSPCDAVTKNTITSDRMVYVRKWLKTKHAVLFCLSNDSFQFNFYDSSRLVMSSDARVVTYMDKDGKLGVYSTSVAILTREPSDLTKRLRYARDMFEQIIRVNATLQQGQDDDENARAS
ncbi:hypothetical protein ATCC90586_001496 [Pythium insidiosum]|nr:hypothetical protein ATCC90586_001496 [Pythium insidiosum]